jgi:hypothetical protein
LWPATSPQPANAAEALERPGELSLRDLSMGSLVQTVAELAKTVMAGDTVASVTLLLKDNPSTVASTGQLAVDLDKTQYERGHGPCLHAARTGELTEIADTRTDSRWRDYTPRAAEHAKGVLVERYKLTPDQALQLLAQASMNANRKARDLADHLVRTGELLVVLPRGNGRRPSGSQLRGRPGP